MPGLQHIIDPDGAPLALSQANGFDVLSPARHPSAQVEKQWASNIDTEGQLAAGSKVDNAEITRMLRITGPDERTFRERQVAFEQKLHKLQREGGVLRVILSDDTHIDWEVRHVTGGDRLIDNRFVHHKRTEDEVTFVCAPFGVGEEALAGTFTFSGSPEPLLECVIDDVGGSAEALARAVITSPDSDVWDLKWGRESRRYSEEDTAQLYYAAGELTPLGGATETTATVDGRAATPVVRQATLSPNWQSQLSTQIDGVGHMTHEGIFEVLVWVHMPTTNTGAAGIGFEYSIGDSVHRTSLEPIYFDADHPREGKILQLSLGQVFLRASGRGPHQWEGQVITRSTVAGDDFDVLGFGLRPLEEGNGRVSIAPTLVQPAVVVTRDEFDQSRANLHGLPIAAAGAVSGPKSPGTLADDASVGTVAWSNPSNARASDDSRATVDFIGGGPVVSHYEKATNFGFAIPAGATITGIVAEIERRCTYDDPDNDGILDNAVRIVKGGAIQATDRSAGGSWPAADIYQSYGSQTDLWGSTWAYTDINAATFGVAISVRSLTDEDKGTPAVDHIHITVYYTDAGGQTWSTTGDATDIAVEVTGHTAQRTEVSDADINTGRYAIAGTTVFTDVVVGISCKRQSSAAGSSERVRGGALARYVDTSNWLFFGPDRDAPSSPITDTMRVVKRVAETVTELGRFTIPDNADYRSVWLHVDRRGRYFCWGVLMSGGLPRLMLAGQDNDLATGAALDDGKGGFYDAKTGATANTRNYDNYIAWIPSLDAAIYQGLSLELSHDEAIREALGGGIYTEITPRGDYLKLSPSGMENRKNRLAFIASPNDPETMGVGFPQDLEVAIYVTPRYRTVPDPA